MPDDVRPRVAEVLDRAPAAGLSGAHWMLVHHQPAPEGSDQPYLATWINVFDDGQVVLKGQH
jgi:hypothetical protein